MALNKSILEGAKIISADTVLFLSLTIFWGAVALYFPMGHIDFFKAYFPAGAAVLDSGTFQYSYAGFKNLPIVSLTMVPFALLGETSGVWLFTGSEILTYLLTFAVFLKYLARRTRDKWVLFFLFLFSKQMTTCLQLGQLTPAAFFLLLLMVIAYLRDRHILAGGLLSFLFLLKIPLGIFFVYFLCKKQYVVVASSMITFALLVGASVALFGIPLHVDYLKFVILVNKGGTLLAYNNQNIFAFVMRFVRPADLYNWDVVPIPWLLYLILTAGVLVFVFCQLRTVSRGSTRTAEKETVELAMVTCLLLLVFPVTWDHYYLWLIFPLYILYRDIAERFGIERLVLLVLAVMLVNFPTGAALIQAISSLSERHGFFIGIVSSPFIGCCVVFYLLRSAYVRGIMANDTEGGVRAMPRRVLNC
jgi:hypothetical protein